MRGLKQSKTLQIAPIKVFQKDASGNEITATIYVKGTKATPRQGEDAERPALHFSSFAQAKAYIALLQDKFGIDVSGCRCVETSHADQAQAITEYLNRSLTCK